MMTQSIELAHAPAFRIGELEILPSTHEVRRGDRREIIEPRVMQVLIALARTNGAVVTRDELVEQCWKGRIIGDDAIHRVLSRLRRVAEGIADGVFKIETITRVGYRLSTQEPVALSTLPALEGGLGGDTNTGSPDEKVDRRLVLAVGAAATTAAGGFWFWNRTSDGVPDEVRIVLRQGRESLKEGTADRIASGVALLRRATEIAPQRAEAWGALALAYQQQSTRTSSAAQEQVEARGVSAARRALALDADNADALAALATMRPFFRRWTAYDAACRRVLAKYPRHWELNISYGHFLSAAGRSSAALGHFNRAISVDPLSPQLQWQVAQDLWCAGRLDEADRAMDRAFELWPRHYAVWFVRNRLHNYTGRAKTTLAIIEDRDARPVGIPDWNFKLNWLEARALDTRSPPDIEAALSAHLDAARRALVFVENAVMFASAVGHVDRAFELVNAYFFDRGFRMSEQRFATEQGVYSARSQRFTAFLFVPPSAALRADPRFDRLMNEIGLEDYWRRSGSNPDYRARR